MMELPNAMMNMDVWTMNSERILEFIFANLKEPVVWGYFARHIRQARSPPRFRTTRPRKRLSKHDTAARVIK